MLKHKKYFFAVFFVAFLLVIAGIAMKTTPASKNQEIMLSAAEMTEQAVPQQETLQEVAVEEVKKEPQIVTYTVKSGDTLESIGNSYGVSAVNIADSSGISQNSIIREGQELRFPSIKGVLYKIKSGETLWDISSLYDVDIEEIASANGISSPELIKIGQEIIIPGADRIKSIAVASTASTVNKTAANKAAPVKVASRSTISSNITAVASGMWPLKGSITSKFGPRWGTKHNGIDIAAPTGTNIYAFMDGRVAFSGWEGGYGKLVIIDHGNGLQSYYGHNSKLIVSAGQSVNKGQHIAEVGSTGDSTGPHCHFEIRKNGVAVNPYNYLK